MRKLITALLCLAIFAGCKKDNSNQASATNKLVGTWNFTKRVSTYNDGTKFTNPYTNTMIGTIDFIRFDNDGTGLRSFDETFYTEDNLEGPYYGPFTYTLSGTSITISYNDSKLNGNQGPVVRTVTFVDDNNIIIQYKSSYRQPNHGEYWLVDEYFSK